jgi:putative membrane protein
LSETVSRSNLSEDRTILANERTFASWMRTSLGCIAIGVGFQGLFPAIEPLWVPRVIATAFLLLAILIVILAQRRASVVISRLDSHTVVTARPINLRILSAFVSLGALALIFAIWTIRIS